MSKAVVEAAKQVQSAQEAVTRYIHAYENVLVAWIDEEGREQIGTYAEAMLARQK